MTIHPDIQAVLREMRDWVNAEEYPSDVATLEEWANTIERALTPVESLGRDYDFAEQVQPPTAGEAPGVVAPRACPYTGRCECLGSCKYGFAQPAGCGEAVGELDRTAPPKVWLQIDTDGNGEDRSQVVPRDAWGDLTWSAESIGGQEVAYIRHDLAYPSPVADADALAASIVRDVAELPDRNSPEVPTMSKPTKTIKAEVLAPCRKCGCPDVQVDSSSWAEASWIDCDGCDYRFQKRCDEETLIEKWNALDRTKMPVYDDGTGGPDHA